MKHSLLGCSIERPNINRGPYSVKVPCMYTCVHKPAKQHAETSFTPVSDPLTGQTRVYKLRSPEPLPAIVGGQ